MLTVVVPYRNNPAGIQRLLSTLPPTIPTVIMDDGSDEVLVLKRDNLVVRRMKRRGYFAGTVNTAISTSETEFGPSDYLLLNQDVWFEDESFIANMRMGHQEACIGEGVRGHPAWRNGYVQGTCMWINGKAWEEVGPFDEADWPLWGCTAEWQLRACRRGWRASPIAVPGLKHERGERQFGSSIRALLQEEPKRNAWFLRTPPLISVVVPCYNYGRFLPDLVASLLGGNTSIGRREPQGFQGFEIVIVDDHSTDDSWDIARRLADPWKAIRAMRRQHNGGTAACLNTGIRHAYGRYILTIDADDMLSTDAVESFVSHLENDASKLYYSDQRRITDEGLGERIPTRDYDFDQLLERNMVPAGTAFSKAAWREAGGYPVAFARGRQDWAFAVAMGCKNHCGQRIPEALYYYRRHGTNRSTGNTNPVNRAEFLRLMQTTFPKAYGGEMAGCCGSRGTAIISRTLSSVAMLPGVDGMTLVEYTGDNVGRTTLRGNVTNLIYTFKGSMRKFYVDNRDLAGVLDYIEGRKYVIQIAAIPTIEDPVLVKEEVQYA